MKAFKDETVIGKLNRMIEFLEKWDKNITIIPKDNNFISKDKIKAKIKELEELQKENREELYKATDYLLINKIDEISNTIYINMRIRDILQSLLEKE